MKGLEVQHLPIFFDYSPGSESMSMPRGVVDLQSTKHAPWRMHSCGGDWDNSHDSVGDLCVPPGDIDDQSNAKNPVLKSGQRYFIEVTLTLPESEINKHLGVFMVEVDLRSGDGSLLASSKQHSMLPYESALVGIFRKTMLLIPLAAGLVSETRTITLLCFDNYVEANDKKHLSLVEVSLGVPNPAAFPATLQTIQIHSATLRYGKVMNSIQTFLHNWRYSCAFFGISIIFMGCTLLALNIWNYRAMKNRWNTQPYADDFFDSDDESAQISQSSLNVRWMDAEIEILEEDDDSDSGAWEPLDSNDKNVHPNEPTTSNGHTTTNAAPNNHFVSSDDDSKNVTAKGTQQEKETPNKAFEEKCLADMVMNGERKWEV